jgi:hypothetical protein
MPSTALEERAQDSLQAKRVDFALSTPAYIKLKVVDNEPLSTGVVEPIRNWYVYEDSLKWRGRFRLSAKKIGMS